MFDKYALASVINDALGDSIAVVDEPLSAHTTFRIGGPTAVYARPASVEAVAQIVRICAQAGVELRCIGCGSDLLVSDDGIDCVVMEMADALSDVRVEGCRIIAQAGVTNKVVADVACKAGLSGYEFASGIPGTVGGAAIMNAGAYGGEFKDVCVLVRCVMPDGTLRDYTHDEARWAYRTSAFDADGCVVVQVELELCEADAALVRARMNDLEAQRASKQPLDVPSAGSTFKRPVGYFVGKLVQDAGLAGYRVGGAQVSEKHTGFVVNAGGATAADVRALIDHVQRVVYERFGVQLEPEVRMWGFDVPDER
ncbi:UDP-N-acetylmuramate dehydrogenase [Adlercreutzia sp. ZJ138]|uniref:UDP-N-acetylmuramate dehydrogenase n=1 Tax=Adlercreutzia sp. ZJ138 TaxID=2709405 RepID=UPI0013EB4BAF|nr:UDP-N-acetylmuramate dehydrogenase [Adlercreutzia sp. ZJ138]